MGDEEVYNSFLNNVIKSPENENSFNFDNIDLNQIDRRVDERKTGGKKLDLGCATITPSTSINDVNNLLTGDTSSNGFTNLLNKSLPNQGDIDPENPLPTDNKSAIKDSFFKNLINGLKFLLLRVSILGVKQRFILLLYYYLTTNNLISDVKESLEKQKRYIKCLLEEINDLITEVLLDLVKTLITKLIKPILIAIAKEKIDAYKGLLSSLLSVLDLFI